MQRALPLVLFAAALLLAVQASAVRAQTVRDPGETPVEEVVDSSDLRSRARHAQSTFERRRVRHLPLARGSYVTSCDEYVGRFCTWYQEGDWHPRPEAPEIEELRRELLTTLDAIADSIPGDEWVLGQRVWYRAEGDDWVGALETARACGAVEPWWCAMLEGLSLHGLGNFEEALEAFGTGLALWDGADTRRWSLPRWPVDGEARGYLEDLPQDSVPGALHRLWALADPLYLVPGNDRRTAHFARWTFARIREDARNPFQIPWSGDLDQLTVRHGWEIGWERERSRNVFDRDRVVGHKHPEGRDYMPPGEVLRGPADAGADALRADRSRPRSLYAPPYAPVLLPAEGQVAVFPRGHEMVVVATHFLPEDTTAVRDHEHPRPWLEAGGQAGMPDQAGLFLITEGGELVRSRRVLGVTDGASLVEAPAGRYVLSAEAWRPSARRAGRHRVGLARDSLPPDLPTLSDLLFLQGGGSEPATLEAALPRVLVRPAVDEGARLGVVFEVAGLGRDTQPLEFRLTVERADRGIFRRAGEFLGLVGRSRPLSLSWGEEAPAGPAPYLRWLDLELSGAEPGTYEVSLEMSMSGRSTVRSTGRVEVRAPHR